VFKIHWHIVNVWCNTVSAFLLLVNTVTYKLNTSRKVSHPNCVYGITGSIMKSVQTQLYLITFISQQNALDCTKLRG